MDYIFIIVAATLASGLTMFSGFGLGTLLLPVFALFLPVEIAIAATALVHFFNGIFKAVLLGKMADKGLVLRFGLPAIIAAFGGVYVLTLLSGMTEIWTYSLFGKQAVITPIKLIIALLMAVFATIELHPRFAKMEINRRWILLGGLLSGFFGGLSGHQGALRSAFLAKVGISPQSFVGTNAIIGLLVDMARLVAYGAILVGARFSAITHNHEVGLVASGVIAAFCGVMLGKRFLHKVTMITIQQITGCLLLVVALLLGLGII
ncbi:MAG: TSUP family transporter [Pseudomonadota bacterium]